MRRTSSGSPNCLELYGKAIPGAEDRQQKIAGFNQALYSKSRVLCIGAGGLIGHIAPTLVRKGIGAITVLDDDEVDVSNLNRQFFYESDIGQNKAHALVRNLQRGCTANTKLVGYPFRLQEAIETDVDLVCDVAICGVDNNPARAVASRYFRSRLIPVIFTAVSADADHGYVFVQDRQGPCLACLFPDAVNDETYPCAGTPAIADILQLVGSLVVYAIDTCLMGRHRSWNFRHVFLSDGAWDSSRAVTIRPDCPTCRGGAASDYE